MEKVRYNLAIQTYMEVFDFVINNGLLVYDADRDFLQNRIVIGDYGFELETQTSRNNWDPETTKKEIVPAIFVLYILTKRFDQLLKVYDIPASPSSCYAYINDNEAKMSGIKTYYSSYQILLELLKQVREMRKSIEESDRKITDYNLTNMKKLNEVFSRLTPLDKRTIECYARLESELKRYTGLLLLRDENNEPVYYANEGMYDDPDYHLASGDSYVDWNEFKECITNSFEYQIEENRFDLHGVYSGLAKNQYISPLGLDGITK